MKILPSKDQIVPMLIVAIAAMALVSRIPALKSKIG
jgi:hypothetical protein